MDKKMENEMETGVIQGLKEPNLSYYIWEALLLTIYIHIPSMVTSFTFLNSNSV